MAKVAAKDLSIGDKVRYTIKDDNGFYRSLSWKVADKHIERPYVKVRLERPETWLEVQLYEDAPFTVTKAAQRRKSENVHSTRSADDTG